MGRTNGGNGRNINKAIAHGLAGIALAAFASVSLTQVAEGAPQQGFQSGTLNVAVGSVDAELGPIFSVDAAFPGMEPQRGEILVRNTGTIDAVHTVSAHVTRTDGISLSDVLIVDVRDRHTGETLYRGKLSELRFASPTSLPAGHADRYAVTVSWPAHADDDTFQGASLNFDLRVDSTPAE